MLVASRMKGGIVNEADVVLTELGNCREPPLPVIDQLKAIEGLLHHAQSARTK